MGMEWTYSAYTGVNFGISFGLCILISIGIFFTFISSKKGQQFISDRIIGIDPKKVEDEEEEENLKTKVKVKPSKPTETSMTCIRVCFCILAGMALSITAVLIFQGCFLANTRLIPTDKCPENPMDCFIFNDTTPNPSPITNSISFRCDPLNTTQFPTNISDPTAWCFGWIIRLQTTKRILDQLGVCTGLLGLFTTLLAVIVYLGKTKKNLVLCITFIICSGVTITLLVVFKWSFSPLTHAVLALGIGLGAFGLILFYILPKKEKKKEPLPLDQNPTDILSVPAESSAKSSPSIITSARPFNNFQRTSKITPK